MGTGPGAGTVTGTGSKTGKETKLEREGGEEENFGTRHIRKEADEKTRHCHSVRDIISVESRWRLQVASSFRHKIRRLPDDVVPRRGKATRGGR